MTKQQRPGTPAATFRAAVLASLCHGSAALAQSDAGLSEAAFLSELPVVLSASRLTQPLAEAPGAVTVIDRAMISASGAREIADLFRLVPGFQVSYASGPNPVVTYHGLSGQFSRRMQVLVDGRSLYSPSFVGGVDWNHIGIAIEDIERIEVVRGTNTAAYGSNAFLGIANIITRDAAAGRGAAIGLRSGNNGIADTLLRAGGKVGDVDLRATLTRRRDSGFEAGPDDRRVSQLNLRADWRLSITDDVQVQLGLSKTAAGAGEFGNPGSPPRTEENGSNFVLAKWRRALGPNDETSLLFSHTWDSNGDTSLLTGTANLPGVGNIRLEADLDSRRRSYRDHIEFQRIRGLSEDVRLAWGVEARHEAVRSRYLFGNGELHSATTKRLFGNVEWRAQPDLIVNAAAMAEHYSLTGTHFAPRLAANWRVTPSHALRAAVARAYRTPSLVEEGIDLFITPSRAFLVANNARLFLPQSVLQLAQIRRFRSQGDLQPERIRVAELGYVGELGVLDASLDVRLFDEHTEQLITTNLLPDTVRNRDEARTRGLDYHLRLQPTRDTLLVVSQSFAHVNANTRDLEESLPAHLSSLLIAQRLPDKVNLSLAHYWVDRTRWLGNAIAVPKYRRLDLRLAKRFDWGASRGEVALVVQNHSDVYSEFSDRYLFKRRAFATLSLEY